MGRARAFTVVGIALILSTMAGAGGAAEPGRPEVARGELDTAYQGRRYALVVGVDEFEDANWRSLRFAEKDADDVARALSDPDMGAFDEVIKLTEPWQTTRESLTLALERVYNANMSPDDVVFLYFSTHGTLARDPNGELKQYLVTYDTDFGDVPGTALAREDIVGLFDRLASRKKVVIFASCHSGRGKSGLPPSIASELERMKSGFFVKPIEKVSEASIVIGVCDWGETAQEHPDLGNDIYTHFFLEGLDKGDRNQDGAVSISEAHDYGQRKTYYFTNGAQRPRAESDVLGVDPIILAGRITGPGKPVLFSYAEGNLKGAELFIDNEKMGELPNGFALEKGWTTIAAVRPGADNKIVSGPIYVRAGERIDLDRVASMRSEPALGVMGSYNLGADPALAEDVMPDAFYYGIAYNVYAFPTADTSLRFEGSYGNAAWEAELDDGGEADVTADAFQFAAALLYNRDANRATYFAGPMAGGVYLSKNIEEGNDKRENTGGTVYPGLMLGARFKISSTTRLELANRLTYNIYSIGDESRSGFQNHISATVYFEPGALLGKVR